MIDIGRCAFCRHNEKFYCKELGIPLYTERIGCVHIFLLGSNEKRLAEALIKPLKVEEESAPKETRCHKCGSKNMVLRRAPIDHWAGGYVFCKDCQSIESVSTYLANEIFTIEPIGEGYTEACTMEPINEEYIAIIKNAFVGQGIKYAIKRFSCPKGEDPCYWFCSKVDLTSEVFKIIPEREWLGELK